MKNNANLPGGSAAAFIATLLLAFGLISYVNPQSSYVLFGNVVFHLPQWDPLGERSGSDAVDAIVIEAIAVMDTNVSNAGSAHSIRLGDSATTITFNDWDLAGSTVGDVFSADLSIATFRVTDDDTGNTRNQADAKTNATNAIGLLDTAIIDATKEQAKYGSYISSLTHTVDNLTNVAQNTDQSRSRIQDADYAVETTNLARTQIIAQASTAMLAQANQSKQSVLALLQ